MTSAQCRSSPAEIRLWPSRPLALTLMLLVVAGVVATWLSGLSWSVRLMVLAVVVMASAPSLRRLMRPDLCLRLHDERLEFRRVSELSWQSLGPDQRCFVSPWYIGWRGRGLRSYGVFRSQLEAEDFRRLAVLLRHGRPR